MTAFFDRPGFLTAHSTMGADLSLLIVIASVALLTVGVILARQKKYGLHRWVQTVAVALNAVPVVVRMIRFFWLYVVPGLPGTLSSRAIDLIVVHAVLGTATVALGVVIVIRAQGLWVRGKDLHPLKTAMRVAYAMYVLTLALGIAVYVVTYG